MANPNRSGLPKRPPTPNQLALTLRPGDVVTIGRRGRRDIVASVTATGGRVTYGLTWAQGSFERKDLVLIERSRTSPATVGDRVSCTDGRAGIIAAVQSDAGAAIAYWLCGDASTINASETFLVEMASASTLSLALEG